MADRKLVVGADGTATYVDLSPVDLAQQPIDAAAAAAVTANVQRLQALRSDVDAIDFETQLRGKTNVQVKNYVQNNVTDLASAKLLLAKVLLYLARTI